MMIEATISPTIKRPAFFALLGGMLNFHQLGIKPGIVEYQFTIFCFAHILLSLENAACSLRLI